MAGHREHEVGTSEAAEARRLVVIRALILCVSLFGGAKTIAAQEDSHDADAWAGDVLDRVGELRLEEIGASLVADPRLSPDPRGGWIYWDLVLQEARLYATDGRLVRVFGQSGEGPGEFRGLVGVVRLGDGLLVALDGRGRISVWSADAGRLLEDFASGVPRPHGIAAARGSEVVILTGGPGTTGNSDVPVLFAVDVETHAARRLFEMSLELGFSTAAGSIESPPPVLFGDSVAMALVPFDSLWVVSLDRSRANRSVPRRSIPIGSEALADSPSPVDATGGPRAYLQWIRAATFVGRFAPMPDGGWVVRLWQPRREGTVSGLVRLDAEGRTLWELTDTPLLLAVDRTSGHLYFWDPESLDPAAIGIFAER